MNLLLRKFKVFSIFALIALLFSCCFSVTKSCSLDDSESCSLSKETSKSYNDLKLENKQKIVTLESFSNIDNEKINRINGKQLREELKKDTLAVVYFCNCCTAKAKDFSSIKERLTKKGFKFYLVLKDYSSVNIILDNNVRPIFSMDTEYYTTKKYIYSFINDVLERDINAKFYKNIVPDMLFFENGKITKDYTLNPIYEKYNIMYKMLVEEQEKKQQ